MSKYYCFIAVLSFLTVICQNSLAGANHEGTSIVSFHGYSGCVKLSNGDVSVILDPNCGGRVLEYSYKGENLIYLDPEQDGWLLGPDEKTIDPSGGRMDIGPEMNAPRHSQLWLGKWTAEITGPRKARLTSVEDKATGVQLIRDLELDKKTSHLKVKQTIKNFTEETKYYFHWGRTFAVGNGICLIPLTPNSRFPKGYILHGPGWLINPDPPEQPNVEVRDNFFIIKGEPVMPQYDLDTYAGWFAYITRTNLLFVKKFPMYPERLYGEINCSTVVVWYNKTQMCELEPIGPREEIKPGKSVSYTEDWWLMPYKYPSDGNADLKDVTELVKDRAK
jgi:hypothetical protein